MCFVACKESRDDECEAGIECLHHRRRRRIPDSEILRGQDELRQSTCEFHLWCDMVGEAGFGHSITKKKT